MLRETRYGDPHSIHERETLRMLSGPQEVEFGPASLMKLWKELPKDLPAYNTVAEYNAIVDAETE